MGVYIENIHMPEDGEHPLWISLHSDGTVEYNANKGDGWQMTTAIPVPPHGRLINADALIAKLNMMIAMAFGEGNTAFHFAYRSLGKVVENAPTIIEAEEGE